MSGVCIDCNCITAGKGLRCKLCANTFKNKSIKHRLKNSKAHSGSNNHFYGKKHKPESLEKISDKNHYLYIDGRTKKFDNWREEVLNRDNFTCQICGKTVKQIRLDCHHIKPKNKYPELEFDTNNGITLCIKCHPKYEKKQNILEKRIKYVR